MTPVLSLTGVSKSFGNFPALKGATLDLGPAERLGIIGPNGSGKTTLINCITGTLQVSAGTIRYKGEDITRLPTHKRARKGIARSFQIPRPFTGMTVLENLLVPLDYVPGQANPHTYAEEILASVGLHGRRGDPAEALSQLELRKLELARALVVNPQVLIADEAMAGLSESEVDDILAILFTLNAAGVAIIMIEHIMHAVMRFSQRIACLETGTIIAMGAPDAVAQDPIVQKVYFGEQTRRR